METLECRVGKLERENRILKRCGVVAAVFVGIAFCMGQSRDGGSPPADEVRTRKLILVDESGKPRASLVNSISGAALALFDETGALRVSLSASKEMPMLSLLDGAGKQRVDLAASSKDGFAQLTLRNEAGAIGAGFTVNKNGPYLGLYDDAGKVRAGLGVLKGGPMLHVEDERGYETTLGVSDLTIPSTGEVRTRSAASIVMLDNSKKVIWQTP